MTIIACLTGIPSAAWSQERVRLDEIAPGVFVHSGAVALGSPANGGDIANLALVVGERSVAVIDTGSTVRVGASLLAAVRARTPLPVSHVILTHMHPDHALGASAFAGSGPQGSDPALVAHAAFAQALAARVETYRGQVGRELGAAEAASVAPVYPTITVTVGDVGRIDLGGRVLTLTAWPTAHTNNDLTVLDAATGTLFAGDLVFEKHLPVIDGSLAGWLKASDALAALPAARVVPGHGSAVLPFPDALAPQLAYLAALRDDVAARIAAGEPMAQAVDRSPVPAGWQLTEAFHRRNVTAAYAELEWQ